MRLAALLFVLALGCVAIVACSQLAHEFVVYKAGSPAPAAPPAMLGAQQVMPMPFPVSQPTIDWVGIGGIVAVQVLTWWLGRRDRRKYHGRK